MPNPTFGILTMYLNGNKLEERPYYEKITVEGRKLGLDVLVFTPEDVTDDGRRIRALVYRNGAWQRILSPFPDAVFDRCRQQNSPRFVQLKQFRSRYPDLLYLNRPLANKWVIYQALAKDEGIRSHLPETITYRKGEDVSAMLRRHSSVFLKPIRGTGGRGIIRIARSIGGSYVIRGRDPSRHIVPERQGSLATALAIVRPWMRRSNDYMVQQGLDLSLANGRVHDYRLLMQKNGSGEWAPTGCAGRVGPRGSITSNLHGGGRAMPMKLLLEQFVSDRAQALAIKERMERLGRMVVAALEAKGYRICELALDIAVDRKGRLWLLEVNPKPSREVFRRIGEKETYRAAIRRPLEYALWLLNRKERRTGGPE